VPLAAARADRRNKKSAQLPPGNWEFGILAALWAPGKLLLLRPWTGDSHDAAALSRELCLARVGEVRFHPAFGVLRP
jgi:hypothetical protein